MSTRYIPTKDSFRQKKLKWINSLCQLHDTWCDCYNPIQHTIILLFEQEPQLEFTPPEKDIIKKCLSGDAPTTKEDGDTIQEGDLAAIFQEPFEEGDADG